MRNSIIVRSVISLLALSVSLAVPYLSTAAPVESDAAMYVDSKAIKERFSTITDQDMEMLRGKKIILLSQSFGANLVHGLQLLAKEDKKYDLVSSFVRGGVPDFSDKAGVDTEKKSNFPKFDPDVFSKYNFLHCMITPWPFTKRVEELDALMRTEPYSFGKTIDVAIIFYHTGPSAAQFEFYAEKMDALQADFPKVRFIYCASGLSGPQFARNNENSFAFSELVRARYQGKAPLYDMGKILSEDYRDGHVFCPEYSNDPAGLHPYLPLGEMMMAKGFLLVLRDALRAPWPPEKLTPLQTGTMPAAKIETLSANHPDAQAVRAILDANGLENVKVDGVSAVENGRIVKLFIKEIGVTNLTHSIGVLTELRLLHLYSDRRLSLPLLKTIDPAIGNCTKLEELLLNSNELTTLPVEITRLGQLKLLSLADNRLKDLPPPVATWANRFDAKGLTMQLPAKP